MKRLIAFDLDDTLAITKSAMDDRMAELFGALLETHTVCVISGGNFEQFKKQVIDTLHVPHHVLAKLHLLPTCGTRYYRYNDIKQEWQLIYSEDIPAQDKERIQKILLEAANEAGYLEPNPDGEVVEDRVSQMTFSGCGQSASPERKYAWDPDQKKRLAIREIMLPQLTDYEIRVGGTTSIDVTLPGIDKAYGMNKLMEELEIGKEAILFVGDKLEEGGNDYPVKAMGIDTIAVQRWEDTALVVETIIKTA